MTKPTFDEYEDMIDSRDVIARIDELEADEDRDEKAQEELDSLKALADEACGSPDWKYGEQLIRNSYFKEYAMEFADDIGATNSDAAHKWPLNCIDWDQAARELQFDYFSVDFRGIKYWIRG